MNKKEKFIFSKENKLLLPSDYQTADNSITGIFLTSSIRFFKNQISTVQINDFKNLKLEKKEVRKLVRIINSSMTDFSIKDNYLSFKTNTNQDKYYDFKNGIIMVKCDRFIDVVEKRRLSSYLEENGFDVNHKKEILENDRVELERIPGKKLTYFFNYK